MIPAKPAGVRIPSDLGIRVGTVMAVVLLLLPLVGLVSKRRGMEGLKVWS